METEATDKPKAVFDKRARSKSAAAQRAKQLVEAAAASASAASSSSPSSIESQPTDQSASSDPSGTDSTEAGGASAPPRTPSLLDQFSDPVNTTAKDRTADMIKELRQASPTGRLLDLFAEPVLGTAAAEQIDVLDQKAPISLPRTTNEHDMVDIILQAVDNCRPLLKVTARKTGTKINYIPEIVTQAEQTSLAVRWIVAAAVKRKRGCKSKMHECIALELLLAFQKKGAARAKRDDLHKVALENRANVLIKWF
ncbi:MAG: hypothetical protein WDW38_003082 [Sanguina aurantia]